MHIKNNICISPSNPHACFCQHLQLSFPPSIYSLDWCPHMNNIDMYNINLHIQYSNLGNIHLLCLLAMSSSFSMPVKAVTCTADGSSWLRKEERLFYNQETNKFNLVFLSGYFTPGHDCFLLLLGLIFKRDFGASFSREEEQNVWERAKGENTPPWSHRYHAPPPVLANEEKWHSDRNNTHLNQSHATKPQIVGGLGGLQLLTQSQDSGLRWQ